MDEVILTDDQAMALAISEGQKGWGWVSPNPAVGCVILDKNNRLLSKGYHQRYGEAHAEINALKGISTDQLQSARLFVTLEPCAHHGKTPPCAAALARLPLSEVIYGLQDPNPLVAGKGLEIIRQAGIGVKHYNGNTEKLEQLCEHFLKNMRHQKPFISLKAAVSLDGKLALKNGQSQWITGEESRLNAHLLRAEHEAILVGVNTFLMDNPSLTIRHPQFPQKTLKVIVLDPKGRGLKFLKESKLFAAHDAQNIVWVTGNDLDSKLQETIKALKINSISVDFHADSKSILDLAQLTQELWKYKVHSVLVEGGGSTISEFINQKQMDRLYLFMAPLLIGDNNGLGWLFHLFSIEKLSECPRLQGMEISTKGQDLLLTARFL